MYTYTCLKRLIILCAALLLPGTAPALAAEKAVEKEWVKLNLPENFVQAKEVAGERGEEAVYFVPKGETMENASEVISLQFFPDTKNAADNFYFGLAQRVKNTCKEFALDKPHIVKTQGITVLRGAIYCGHNPKTNAGQFINQSLAQGVQGVHVVQRTKGMPSYKKDDWPLSEAETKDWAEFFNGNTFCMLHKGDKTAACIGI